MRVKVFTTGINIRPPYSTTGVPRFPNLAECIRWIAQNYPHHHQDY